MPTIQLAVFANDKYNNNEAMFIFFKDEEIKIYKINHQFIIKINYFNNTAPSCRKIQFLLKNILINANRH